MTLALEIGGVLIGFLGVAALLGTQLDRVTAIRLAALMVPAVLAMSLATASLWPTWQLLIKETGRDSKLSPDEAALAGGTAARVPVGFLSWAAGQIPSSSTFFLQGRRSPVLWATYQLMPRREVSTPGGADWVILYASTVQALGAARAYFEPPTWFVPGFGIARRR